MAAGVSAARHFAPEQGPRVRPGLRLEDKIGRMACSEEKRFWWQQREGRKRLTGLTLTRSWRSSNRGPPRGSGLWGDGFPDRVYFGVFTVVP